MKVDRSQVEHVARLARIALSEHEKDTYSEQLSTILDFFDRLKEVDTEGVEPTSHVLEITNIFDKDEVRESFDREEILKNAPDSHDGFFRVPKILG